MVEWKKTVRGDFFEKPDKIFDSESIGRNFISLAPSGGEKKYFQFFHKMMSLVAVSVFSGFRLKIENYIRLYLHFFRKNTPDSLFSFYQWNWLL